MKSVILCLACLAVAPVSPPATSPAATQAAAAPSTVMVKLGSIPLKFDSTGYFEPVDSVELRLKLKAFNGELTVTAVAPNGAKVQKGDKLLVIDPAPFIKQLAAAMNDDTLAHATLEKSEADAKISAETDALNLRIAEDGVKDAQTAVKWFDDADGPDQLKAADLQLKEFKDNVDDRSDELDQLKKMYKTEELTSATADIVVKRAVRGLDQAKMQLEMAQHRNEKSKTLAYEYAKRNVIDNLTRAKQALAVFKVAMAENIVARQASLVTSRAAVAAADEKLADLKADGEKLTFTAPHDGVLWYGQFSGGGWQNGGAKAIRVDEKVSPQGVLMTLCKPGKLRLVMELPESQYFVVPASAWVTVTPTAYPQLRFEGTCDTEPRTATATQTGPVYPMPVQLSDVDEKLIPGQKASVRVPVPELKNVLVLPTGAVTQGFVTVLADGKESKRAVVTGRSDGKTVEIVSGLREGEKVLTGAKP